jgi:hypothetical protein
MMAMALVVAARLPQVRESRDAAVEAVAAAGRPAVPSGRGITPPAMKQTFQARAVAAGCAEVAVGLGAVSAARHKRCTASRSEG